MCQGTVLLTPPGQMGTALCQFLGKKSRQQGNSSLSPPGEKEILFWGGFLLMRVNVRFLTRTAIFLALTLALQGFRLPTFLTGPFVNLLLALAVIWVGTASGVIIGLLTPWAALLLGILPAPLAPAIPFIMIGNALYSFSIGLLHRHFPTKPGQAAGVVAGSVAKFLVIAGAATYVLTLPPPITGVLLLPQLYNALIGGLLAVVISTSLPSKSLS